MGTYLGKPENGLRPLIVRREDVDALDPIEPLAARVHVAERALKLVEAASCRRGDRASTRMERRSPFARARRRRPRRCRRRLRLRRHRRHRLRRRLHLRPLRRPRPRRPFVGRAWCASRARFATATSRAPSSAKRRAHRRARGVLASRRSLRRAGATRPAFLPRSVARRSSSAARTTRRGPSRISAAAPARKSVVRRSSVERAARSEVHGKGRFGFLCADPLRLRDPEPRNLKSIRVR